MPRTAERSAIETIKVFGASFNLNGRQEQHRQRSRHTNLNDMAVASSAITAFQKFVSVFADDTETDPTDGTPVGFRRT